MKTTIKGTKCRIFHVLLILLVGGIGINTFTSCSSDSSDDDDGKGNNGTISSSSSDNGVVGSGSSSSVTPAGSSSSGECVMNIVGECVDGSSSSTGNGSSSSVAECGGEEYDPTIEFCLNNVITPLCGGNTYTATEFCYEPTQTIHPLCNGNDYDPTDVFCDTRTPQTLYKHVTIGTQIWMAENLNYPATSSKCYEGEDDNCDEYGRLYEWSTTICPSGWHLPTNAEWTELVDFVESDNNCDDCAATHLKAVDSWGIGEREDTYGFAALAGGYAGVGGIDDNNLGVYGNWWTADEASSYFATIRYMLNTGTGVGKEDHYIERLNSVRCVKN